MSERQIITNVVSKMFRSFGGGEVTPNNPIAAALKDNPPQFAMGVDVGEVVNAVLEIIKYDTLKQQRDDLLAALEAAQLMLLQSDWNGDERMNIVTEAIAKAKK